MKPRLIIFSILLSSAAVGQPPTDPILRIENTMHTAISRRVSVDKAGKYVLTSSEDKTARLWDATTGQLLKIYRIPIDNNNDGKVYSCALFPDGDRAALGGWTGYDWDDKECIYIIDVQTGELLQRLKDLPDVVNDIEISPDGRFLAAGFGDGSAYVYSTATLELVKQLPTCDNTMNNLAFDIHNRLATVCYDGKIRLYDSNYELIKEMNTIAGKRPYSVCFDPKGTTIAIAYTDAMTVELRDANTLEVIATPSLKDVYKGEMLNKLCFSTDGKYLVAGGTARVDDNDAKIFVRLWDNGGKGAYSDVPLFGASVFDIKNLPNGNLVILSGSPALAMIDTKSNVLWFQETGNNKYAAVKKSHFRVSFDGKSIGVTPSGKTPYSFDLDTRQIKDEEADFEPPIDNSQGTLVTNWSATYDPLINGQAIDFLKRNERNLCVDISSNGKEVIWGCDFSITKTDNTGKKIWKNEDIPATAWNVNITGNDKLVVVALDDGTIRWYRMVDGKEILAFFLDVERKRWVLFTPSGYYDAAPGSEDLLGWHLNNGPDKMPSFYPLSRFKEKYYRPDVIDALLDVLYEGSAVKMANKLNNKTSPESVRDIREKLPPTVTISSPVSGSLVSKNTITINYSVSTPTDAPVKNVRVLVDGRPVANERGVIVTAGSDRKAIVTIPSQNCTITVLAENENGISPAATLFLKWEAAVAAKDEFIYKPKLYVLAIGVSDYTNPDLKLRFASKDAGDFVKTLSRQKGKLYQDVIVKPLLDKAATKDAITDGLDWIQRQTGQKDMAMIFYAGHGVNDNNGIYYMLPVGADMERIRTTCLNFEELRQTVSSIAGKVVVFIDACHSGNVMGGRRGIGGDINSLVNELSNTENGAITFTSSTGKEYSLENEAWGNGAFTKALIEGLNGKAAIAGKDKITTKSLDAYISERVKEITSGKQHPTSVTPPNVPDFPIGVTQ